MSDTDPSGVVAQPLGRPCVRALGVRPPRGAVAAPRRPARRHHRRRQRPAGLGVARAVHDAPRRADVAATSPLALHLRRNERAHLRRGLRRQPGGVVPVARRRTPARGGLRTMGDRVPLRLVVDDGRPGRATVELHHCGAPVATPACGDARDWSSMSATGSNRPNSTCSSRHAGAPLRGGAVGCGTMASTTRRGSCTRPRPSNWPTQRSQRAASQLRAVHRSFGAPSRWMHGSDGRSESDRPAPLRCGDGR